MAMFRALSGTAAGAAKLMGKSIAELTFYYSRARHASILSFACATDLAELSMQKSRHRLEQRLIVSIARLHANSVIYRGASNFDIANGDSYAVATAMIGMSLGLSQQQLDEAADPVVAVLRRTGIGGGGCQAVSAGVS